MIKADNKDLLETPNEKYPSKHLEPEKKVLAVRDIELEIKK